LGRAVLNFTLGSILDRIYCSKVTLESNARKATLKNDAKEALAGCQEMPARQTEEFQEEFQMEELWNNR
jgi:hypothetical protein